MPNHAPKYTIRDEYDPDDEMPTDTDPLEAYQTYVDDRDAGHGDMGFTLGDFERYIAEMRQRRKRRLPKEERHRLFQTVLGKPRKPSIRISAPASLNCADAQGSENDAAA
jgi:hypothetical protein